ncbi:uncharacterized protein LOC122253906 isoform X2 [Penaeus japonicus]|uniref:uncharacterized protein LOC122253906 isoform X2 n=1 Tax=Penaeus japonicus TaxID=27405 RepID=UPI001C717512|nr:uncharacterized protein LOC122253906 isoform X2 [Penaeus japonicus]
MKRSFLAFLFRILFITLLCSWATKSHSFIYQEDNEQKAEEITYSTAFLYVKSLLKFNYKYFLLHFATEVDARGKECNNTFNETTKDVNYEAAVEEHLENPMTWIDFLSDKHNATGLEIAKASFKALSWRYFAMTLSEWATFLFEAKGRYGESNMKPWDRRALVDEFVRKRPIDWNDFLAHTNDSVCMYAGALWDGIRHLQAAPKVTRSNFTRNGEARRASCGITTWLTWLLAVACRVACIE